MSQLNYVKGNIGIQAAFDRDVFSIDIAALLKALVTIKTDTVGIITAVRNRDGCDFFFILAVRATRTTIVITSAWMAMLTTLTPPPTKNCRNISSPNI
jgi:hypothetical protein